MLERREIDVAVAGLTNRLSRQEVYGHFSQFNYIGGGIFTIGLMRTLSAMTKILCNKNFSNK